MDYQFPGKHLKVLKPVTHDGANIVLDDDFRGKFKEIRYPLAALESLKAKNAKLPRALQLRIEEVYPGGQDVITKPAPKKVQAQEAEADDEPAVEETKPAAKRGPKPKSNDLD